MRLPDKLESNGRVEVRVNGTVIGTRRIIDLITTGGSGNADDGGLNDKVTIDLSGLASPNLWTDLNTDLQPVTQPRDFIVDPTRDYEANTGNDFNWQGANDWNVTVTRDVNTSAGRDCNLYGANSLSIDSAGPVRQNGHRIAYVLVDHYTTVGNGTTVETDLYSDTLAAGLLATNGDKVSATYGGSFVSSGTATREVKLYFAGTVIFDSGALTLSLSAAWNMDVLIIRVSASVIRYAISFTTEGAALAAYTAVGELTGLTLANTAVLKVTGQAAGIGAASSDILAKLGTVSFVPAA